MSLLLLLVGASSSVPPTPAVAGLVYGGDETGFRAFGGDESSGDGKVVGGDSDSNVVFGGDQ